MESMRMPASLSHAFYFNEAIEALFVRTSQWFGRFCDRVVEHMVIDGAVHETTFFVRWLGHFFRSIQTGFVRAYALLIAFGVGGMCCILRACGSCTMITALGIRSYRCRVSALRISAEGR